MPYWITDSLAGIPAFLWIYAGLGGVWALTILPRAEWRLRIEVIAVAFVMGPMLLTAWMFFLGTVGSFNQTYTLTTANVLAGTVVLALIGLVIAWRKARQPDLLARPPSRFLLSDERVLIVLMIAALIVRWFVISYWPFTAYDALWVYGYEGRLYALLGYIPKTIGYYPQFLSLQYAFAQLGGINDHMARAGLLFLHIGSILATCVLGSRLFNKRTGLIAAAIWALYPSVGEWARAGDLEIPLAFVFTLAAAFFLLAWFGHQPRRRYTLIAGVMLGVGLWIKPTMAAFILGMGLMVLVDLAQVRFDWRQARPRLEVALFTLIAAVPLGGVWYLRNILLGLPPLVFPPEFWQSLAQRSGGEFGWPLAALIAWAVYLRWRYPRYDWRLGAVGLALVLLALVPTALPNLAFLHMEQRRMSIIEFGLLAAGIVVLAVVVRLMARDLWDDELRATAAKLGWGLALALPYFVTWFYSYSYHYRLSFAVVPLLILPLALVLARLFTPERVGAGVRRLAYLAMIVGLALSGVVSTINDPNGGGDYLWTDKYPDDMARYRSGNAALINVVDGLRVWIDQHPGETLHVVAPGVDRLPFFFPLQDIRIDQTPTQLDQLQGVDYFVYSKPEGSGSYEGVPQIENQVIEALNRHDIMRRAWGMDDGIFKYDIYELNLAPRYEAPHPAGVPKTDVIFGDGLVRYLGYDVGGFDLWPGRHVIVHFFYQVLKPLPEDYSIYVHLRDQNGNVIANWDGPVARGLIASGESYYSTLVWQPGEYISDERRIQLPNGMNPSGTGYRMYIGLYNAQTGERVPITIDGQPAPDGLLIDDRFEILEHAPS